MAQNPLYSTTPQTPVTPADGGARADDGTEGRAREGMFPSEDLPRVFARYVLFDRIGRGGMADIFLAVLREDVLKRRFVLKQILPELGDDPAFEQMLVTEARLAAHLSHANVVQTYELGRSDEGPLYIAMEYVEGFDLHKLLGRVSKARVGLPAEFAAFIVLEVLRGLGYAHRAKGMDGEPLGLVHRDVSPSNVLISFEGEVKLCDFGIARALHTNLTSEVDEAVVHRTRVAGKSAYMAPEQARGEAIDLRADLYAAGVLLWELFAGRRMIRGSEEEMLARARAGVAPELPKGRPIPKIERLQAVLDRALAKDPSDRFDAAEDFIAALREFIDAVGWTTTQSRLGAFLTEHFAEEIVALRREREAAAKELLRDDLRSEDSVVRAIGFESLGIASLEDVTQRLARVEPSDDDTEALAGRWDRVVDEASGVKAVSAPVHVDDTDPDLQHAAGGTVSLGGTANAVVDAGSRSDVPPGRPSRRTTWTFAVGVAVGLVLAAIAALAL